MNVQCQFHHKAEERIVPLLEVDELMCAYFGVPVDPEEFHEEWMDRLGPLLAMGLKGDLLHANLRAAYLMDPSRADRLIAVANYLEETFFINHWTD